MSKETKAQSWYNEYNLWHSEIYFPTNTQSEMLPTWGTLIQRNLSTMRYHMLQAQKSESNLNREFHLNEAAIRIKLHNNMVRNNRKQEEMIR